MTPKFVKMPPPHDRSLWVKVYFQVRDNRTGVVKRLDGEKDIWGDPDTREGFGVSDFSYSMGNYSCDCNRSIFFDRANGTDHPNKHHTCGHDRFDLNVFLSDGTPIYTEFGDHKTD